MGLFGILITARERGRIPALAPVLDVLQHHARVWFSPSLRTAVLQHVNELT
ncbi:MAG: DUF3368 domain-containing protein [Verrucomicrobiales bacterium]